MSLIRISRDPDGTLELRGRAWQEDGSLSARYWSEAVKERKEPSGVSSLLLEGRTAPGPECTATGRDGRNPPGVRRSRGRVLHDSLGGACERQRADFRCLPAR